MLIKGASALCGSRLVKGQDILLDGARIAAIGKDLDAERGEEVLDGRGKLAIPGLINSHLSRRSGRWRHTLSRRMSELERGSDALSSFAPVSHASGFQMQILLF
jgi:hypothetical protein